MAAKIRYIDTSGLPEGFDIVDLLETGVTGNELTQWFKDRVRDGIIPESKPTSKPKTAPKRAGEHPFKTETSPELINNRPRHNCKVTCLAGVTSKAIEWIWQDRIPRGKLIIIGGKPGLGKTQIALSIAATITIGGPWHASAGCAPIGDVIILSAEDDPADTLKPRLVAAGANVKRVHILESVEEISQDGEKVVDRQFNMSRHISDLEELLKNRPEIVLIILDPISAYIGARDSHKDSDVREILGPLSQLAAEYGVAIIGIVHLNKSMNPDPMARFMGSTALVAAARVAFLVHGDDDSDERLFLPVKSNLAKPVPGLTYKIVSVNLPGGIETSKIEWTGETGKKASEVLINSIRSGEDTTALTGAKEWISELLKNGPVPASEVKKAVKDTPYTYSKVQRAAAEAGIKSIKRGRFHNSNWHWMTAEQAANLDASKV